MIERNIISRLNLKYIKCALMCNFGKNLKKQEIINVAFFLCRVSVQW